MTVDIVLEDIKEICKKYKAKEVILFGSRAKGTALERSDIDTCKNNLLLEDIKEYGKKLL